MSSGGDDLPPAAIGVNPGVRDSIVSRRTGTAARWSVAVKALVVGELRFIVGVETRAQAAGAADALNSAADVLCTLAPLSRHTGQ